MTHGQRTRSGLARTVLALVGLLSVVLGVTTAPVSAEAARPALSYAAPAPVLGPPASYDNRLGATDCDLLGREYTKGHGCSRTDCVDGAVPFRKTYGAEACALRGQPQGLGFVTTVDARQCAALQRRWIAQVNYCASEPDRTVTALYNASQCVSPANVYVNLSETEGYYDECLTAERAFALTMQSAFDQTTLSEEVALHSEVQCAHRPGHVFTDGSCVSATTVQRMGGGVAMIGDSLTWRGNDELARLRPTFTIDGEPARRLTALRERLSFYRSVQGEPAGLIIQLGTSPASSFSRRDLDEVVATLPATTQLMFVLPYLQLRADPVVVSPGSARFAGWMRSLAQKRKNSCVADWPAYVQARPGILQDDGAHPQHAAERQWARFVSQQWSRC